MDASDHEALKVGVGKQVVLGFRDGEVTLAEPHLMSDEDEGVIYDVVSTNRSERYTKAGAAYLACLSEIDIVAGPEILSALIGALFAPDEQPVFIDSSASVEEITHDAATFVQRMQAAFQLRIGTDHLAMTVPELALHVRRLRSAR